MTVLLTGLLTCLALIVAIGPQSAWLLRQGLRRDRVMLAITCCLAGDVVLVALGTAGVGAVLDHLPWLLEVIRWMGVSYLLWFAWRSFHSALRPQAGMSLGPKPDSAGNRTTPTHQLHLSMHSGAEHKPETTTVSRAEALGASSPYADDPRTSERDAPQQVTAAPTVRVAKVSTATTVAGTGLAVSLLNPHAWVDSLVVLGTMANTFGAEKWLFALGACVGSVLWFMLLGLSGSALARPLNRPRTWQVIDVVVGLTMLLVAGLLAFGGF